VTRARLANGQLNGFGIMAPRSGTKAQALNARDARESNASTEASGADYEISPV
jgi:hypothetical protein